MAELPSLIRWISENCTESPASADWMLLLPHKEFGSDFPDFNESHKRLIQAEIKLESCKPLSRNLKTRWSKMATKLKVLVQRHYGKKYERSHQDVYCTIPTADSFNDVRARLRDIRNRQAIESLASEVDAFERRCAAVTFNLKALLTSIKAGHDFSDIVF